MATTQKGIYYPDNYDAVADIPSDMMKMAESIENADFLQTLYRFKGTVDTVADLSLKTNVNLSDTYKCLEDDNNYTWNGTDWINIGQNVDLDEITAEMDEVNNKVENLSKNYKGTNITAPTIEGYGRLLKIYGKTEEIGTGEKSPDNPYELKSIGDNGVIKIVSKNGEDTTEKQIACKPLCCLKDNDNNIIAQDYINFTENKIHRELDIARFSGSEEWIKSSATDADRFILYTSYDFSDENIAISNMLNHNSGEDWSKNEFRVDNYNGHRIIVTMGTYGGLTLEQFKAKLAQSNFVVIFKRGTAIDEHINCSDAITQFENQTTIYNIDNAEIEISLTQHKTISDINVNCSNIKINIENLQNENQIEQANDFVVATTGYTLEDVNIFRQENHYWGTFVVLKNEGKFTSQVTVCNLKKSIIGTVNSFCALSDGRWSAKGLGYLYVANNIINVVDSLNTNQYHTAKINIDVVVE